jgi:hypothetical protein
MHSLRVVFFWDQSDVGMIDAFEIRHMTIKIMTEPIHVSYNDMSGLFKEQFVKTIWPRNFVIREVKNNLVNFFSGKWIAEKVKIIVPLNQILKIKLHGGFNRGAKPSFELLPKKSTNATMILHHSAIGIFNLRDAISHIPFSGHIVEEFRVLIPKQHNTLSEAMSSICFAS